MRGDKVVIGIPCHTDTLSAVAGSVFSTGTHMIGSAPRTVLRILGTYRFVLVEALVLLCLARILSILPMHRYTRLLGIAQRVHGGAVGADDIARAEHVARAIRGLAPNMPFRALCIEQAIATRLALRWRGIPATAYIGVFRDAAQRERDHAGHAWLKVGDRVVIGGPDVSAYLPLMSFA